MDGASPNRFFKRMGLAALGVVLVLIGVGAYGLYFAYTTEAKPETIDQLNELRLMSWSCVGVGAACMGVWLWARKTGYV